MFSCTGFMSAVFQAVNQSYFSGVNHVSVKLQAEHVVVCRPEEFDMTLSDIQQPAQTRHTDTCVCTGCLQTHSHTHVWLCEDRTSADKCFLTNRLFNNHKWKLTTREAAANEKADNGFSNVLNLLTPN